MSQTTEKAFETRAEELLLENGWVNGSNADWDKKLALFPSRITHFIARSQPELWDQMKKAHGADLEPMLIKSLVKELEIKGTLHILRHGFKFYGKLFKLAYFRPAHNLSWDVLELFNQNELTVTRQVPCHPATNATVDMLFALNGLPIATIELKNPGTGQTWRNAITQYKNDRDPRTPLFEFKKRALVHFAIDPDEAYMTTRLRGDSTYFLPFNRGSHPNEVKCGAGNPQHSSGYRTGYLWEEVFSRESFLEIVGSFMFIEKKDEKIEDGKGGHKRITKETMIFPRYHQLRAVRRLVRATQTEQTGYRYLIQHSAGSGKTNSISWLSHRLASLHSTEDKKIFDCVIVITDRKVLDRQLQDAIFQIEHQQGVVATIDQNSKQLAEALIDGTKIVVTTLQKFPFILKGLLTAAGAENADKANEEQQEEAKEWAQQIASRKYAVIIDEAHSSQTGEAAREMKAILGESEEDEEEDWEERLARVLQSREHKPNLSFYAFTATPKGKTLETFGRKETSETAPEAFDVYSMRQAIEEGFILDVLTNYTTYATYYRFVKKSEDDPNVPKKKAKKALAKFLSLHPYNIGQRTEIMVEHFRNKVMTKLNHRAKAMVVTQSREHAVRYKLAFEDYIKTQGYDDIRPLVAFSGTVKHEDFPNEGYTEPSMNTDVVTSEPIGEGKLPARFNSPDYQVLLVANKYQTGFDQPLLCAMYVDKRLDGVQAVQTLSRLNRKIPGKEEPFVLDFANQRADIEKAFKPYYDTTLLEEESDPSQLEVLKHELDAFQIYHESEIEAYARIFYRPVEKQTAADHQRMEKHIQPAVDRFNNLEEEKEQDTFRKKLKGYVSVYGFLSQILPYTDPDLEKLFSFGKFLHPHLPKDRAKSVHLDNRIQLEYYRIQTTGTGNIVVAEGEPKGVKSPTDVGTGKEKEEEAPLSEIIAVLNDACGTEFGEEDRLFFEQIKEKAINDPKVVDTAKSNPLDKFELGVKKLIEDLMIQRLGENDDIVTRYMEDPKFQGKALPILAKEIFKEVNKKEAE
ncbi:MAG: type I restriction endonuclease subunit R [Roseibacillus sp.]